MFSSIHRRDDFAVTLPSQWSVYVLCTWEGTEFNLGSEFCLRWRVSSSLNCFKVLVNTFQMKEKEDLILSNVSLLTCDLFPEA